MRTNKKIVVINANFDAQNQYADDDIKAFIEDLKLYVKEQSEKHVFTIFDVKEAKP
jgi:hypothetical protein